jgi:hypothetical protein
MNKPILFMTSSNFLEIENLYYLRDLGTLLNLGDPKLKDIDINNYMHKNFIICNMKNKDEVEKLRFIDPANVVRVAVLRSCESCKEDWVTKLKPEYTIKGFDFVKTVGNAVELLNLIKNLSLIKIPDGDVKFAFKKVWAFLSACFKGSN